MNWIIRNALTLIHVASEDVAINHGEFGHLIIALSIGEVVHIVKCIPITCHTKKSTECYNKLPVLYKNESYFLTSKNRIFTKFGTRRKCSSILSAMLRIHSTWYRFVLTRLIVPLRSHCSSSLKRNSIMSILKICKR